MGMPAPERRTWTRAEVVALIDANPLLTPRYELVDGELLVTPSPRGPHQFAVAELHIALHVYLKRVGLGAVLVSPFDVELEPGTLTQPDIFVVARDEATRLRHEMPARNLLLAVEVISPGSARHDRVRKRALYQRTVPEYWIVDLDARIVERWRPGDERPEMLEATLEWRPAGADQRFVLELREFFDAVLGEPE
jgi:Uma2 family endonuclease